MSLLMRFYQEKLTILLLIRVMVQMISLRARTGKGGHHRVYFPAMNREEYGQFVTETITNKLKEVFASSRKS